MRVSNICVYIIIITLTLFPFTEVRAERANAEEMELVCQNWLSYMVAQQGNWAGDTNPSITNIQEIVWEDTVLGRCFTISPRGVIIVPILKDLPPVKVFSDKCEIDLKQSVGFSQLLKEVLLHRIRLFIKTYGSLDAVQPSGGNVLFGSMHREQWSLFLNSQTTFNTDLREGSVGRWAVLGPLLTTSWDQFRPYNNFCPIGDGDTCLVGCVATAAAQIMKYHEWPDQGQGQHTYWWDGDNSVNPTIPVGACSLYADFSDPYDWVNMPNNCWYGCSPTERNALAELCYEVGVAFNMDYGVLWSGAFTFDALTVFPTYFRYSNAIDREDRSSYFRAEDWFNVIRSEIYAERPMQYRISGHSIVCDGCGDTGGSLHYHMNYGWEYGQFTGWWTIDDIPGSSDPMVEYLIRNIIPLRETIWTIDTLGTGDFPTIQAAIDSAIVDSGDVIELLNGRYTGTGNRSIDYHGKSITIRSKSGNPDSCIIDCEYSGERGFLFQSGEGEESVLEGVTIRRGIAFIGGGIACVNNSSPTFIYCHVIACSADVGGGVHCEDSSPRFINCHIGDNTAANYFGYGGGVCCEGDGSPVFLNCSISGNQATGPYGYGGGIFCWLDCTPQFSDCGIGGNGANYGGGSFTYQASPNFIECSFGVNGAVSGGGGVYELNSSSIFKYCFIGNSETQALSSEGGGVYCDGASSTFESCIIAGNQADLRGGGVYCRDTSYTPTFRNCTLYYNRVINGAGLGGGVYLDTASAIFNSTIITNSSGEGIYFRNSATSTVEYCDITGNMGGDIVFYSNNPSQAPPGICQIDTVNANGDSCDIYFNIDLDPMFKDPLFGNYRLGMGSPCIGTADPITSPPYDYEGIPRPSPLGTYPDMGAHESYRGIPAEHLCESLRDTLGPGSYLVVCDITVDSLDTLLLMPGTTFLFNGAYSFTIYGTLFAEGTESDSIIFTADTLINPSCWKGIRFFNTISSNSRLAYCLIEHGLATGTFPDNSGGGIHCYNSSPSLSNCSIVNNSAVGTVAMGGGVFCENNSSPDFDDCFIGYNTATAGGGLFCIGDSPTFMNCIISDNTANGDKGGGVYCQESASDFTSCTINDNHADLSGGGVYCINSQDVEFTNCTINENSTDGDGGGVYCYDYSPTFTGCVITGNLAGGGGGGVYCGTMSAPVFTNCSIALNSAGGNGGGVCCMFYATPTINSTIIAFSTGSGIHFELFNQGSVTNYSDVFGNSGGDIVNATQGPTGIGTITTTNANGDPCDQYFNIYLDPIFMDTSLGDFHLAETSPCIDAGDPALPLDPDGTVTDIGAYYYSQVVAPPMPVDDAVILISGNNVILSWSPVTEDTTGNPIIVDYYRIYRDTSSLFVPSGLNLIDSTITTSFMDPAVLVTSAPAYFYDVTAVSSMRTRRTVLQDNRQVGEGMEHRKQR